MRERRLMQEWFPELYRPKLSLQRPQTNSKARSNSSKPLGEAKHVYKLMGSLYEPRESAESSTPPPERAHDSKSDAEAFQSQVLSEVENSAKKARSASIKARKTADAMSRTAGECRDIQHTFKETIKSINKTARLAYLDSICAKDDFGLPLEWLADDANSEAQKRLQALQKQF
eukprot:CAMPEP_0185571394 /NCGR_PEP_ID=MMETSP0434-20130131/3452_1 /TAXON_ID=626734 ORGANISM="Favella taraikaensis, Strain Fe Narragansett Bay" /NCGR_SAMPLE_ID=MMETSP0434 /ASSEMBLY_ACC=CAM_ASM_000379 /LENGTH=172 /DNA_ID=CAMNT_0028186811 /DNA_START=97 /DNA_END=615 /DNA_ORIENTATION=+